MKSLLQTWWIPGLAACLAVAALLIWLQQRLPREFQARLPGQDQQPQKSGDTVTNAVLLGSLTLSDGQPGKIEGSWPWFRGLDLSGVSGEGVALAHSWPPAGPRPLWSIEVGEGYAGAALWEGRVFLMDYDREQQQDALRCLSLADGREIWRYAYPVQIKRNHGMSRTVPAVGDGVVVAIGPKCHVTAADARTGELLWGFDLVQEFGTTVPPWYAGQCPLIDGSQLILAPAGKDVLLVALDLHSGETVWQTPNPRQWKMTHSSVMPVNFHGRKAYVYCASGGVVAVSAEDGSLLWETDQWKISIATVPSPLALPDNRLFLSGGYNAGSAMLKIHDQGGRCIPEVLFRLDPEVFGATQHTPILYQNHIFGVRPDGQFVCLDLEGNTVWNSGADDTFGLGPFMIADEKVFVMGDSGKLSLLSASTRSFELLAECQVLHGRESWGPMALAGGRLLVRDLKQMVCLDVTRDGPP